LAGFAFAAASAVDDFGAALACVAVLALALFFAVMQFLER